MSYKFLQPKLKIAFFVVCAIFISQFLILNSQFVSAQTTTPGQTPTPTPDKSSQASELSKKIEELESKISDLKSQENTLSAQIKVMDSQIELAEARIASTEKDITDLTLDIDSATKRVNNLENSLENVSRVLINRIVATYQTGGVESIHVLLASDDISDLFSRSNYIKLVQAHDKKLMYNAQQARNDYENQKNIFEDKKAKVEALKVQLEDYNSQLDREKQNKETLLEQTKGSEANYQALLAEAKAEYEAIQGIISGNTNEGEIGHVNQGDMIATIISGASCNSTGTHLHFTVRQGSGTLNPFSYLKSIDHVNRAGDPFNPSGDWNWPIDAPIQFHQGYGNTGFASISGFYSFHNGIDISGSSSIVRAVKPGTLYQGSYTGSNGCRLRYVRLNHDDSDLDTLYLHVNYVR